MRIQKLFAYIFAATAIIAMMVSCKPGVPDEYIQPGDMEDFLYDYHIAMAMAEQGDGTKSDERTVAYKQAVLKKYGYTERQVDQSLQYYMRHTEQLHDIYDNLSDRLNDEAKDLGANGSTISNDYSANGDTTNVWRGAQALVLSPVAGYNSYSFSVSVDSAFHKGDRLSLEFNSNYIIQEGMRNATAILTVVLSNDSIVSQSVRISSNSMNVATFNDFGNIGIKAIKGYFIFSPDNALIPSNTVKILCLTNIRLLRMHSVTPNPSSANGMPGSGPVQPGQPAPTGSSAPPQSAQPMMQPAQTSTGAAHPGPPQNAQPMQQPGASAVPPQTRR